MGFRPNDAAASLLQRFIGVRTRNLKSRKKGEEQSAQNSGDEGKGDDTTIDMDLIKPRNIARAKDAQEVDSPPGEKKSGAGTRNCENDTFDQQLPDNADAAGPERSANRNLALALVCTCQ